MPAENLKFKTNYARFRKSERAVFMLAYMPVRNRTKYMRKAGICALFYRKSVGYGRGFRVLSLELVRQNFRRQTYKIHKIAVDFCIFFFVEYGYRAEAISARNHGYDNLRRNALFPI